MAGKCLSQSLGVILLAGSALIAAPALADDCTDLTKLTPPDATVTAAAMETGAFESLADGIGATTKVTVPFCRVTGIAKSEPASSIGFELWLPPADQWNGRMLASGGLGTSGAVIYPALNDALTRGFAALGDDLGHQSNAFSSDWAVGHPARVKDWGYRGSHYSAVAAKAIIAAYYGRPASRSYFSGCSHGGGAALAEAQRYPEDYDGIIAGAFGHNQTGLEASYVWTAQAALNDQASNLPQEALALLGKAAVETCDALDGVTDGIIGNLKQCNFDPAVLQCKAGESADCLTAPQVEAVKKIYAGPKNSAGKQIFAGLDPGSEFLWGFLVAGPETFLGGDFFKYMVYDGKDWNWRTMNLDTDIPAAESKIGADVDNVNPNLSGFAARGGKLIMYNGLADALVQAGNAIEYYEAVLKASPDSQSFTRLYLAPGMGHCSSGPGPNAFGGTRYLNAGQPNPPVLDAEHDIVAAIMAWVEEGKAPDSIIATKFTDDDPSKGIAMQRPLCPYPQEAKYEGSGDPNDAANFTCRD
jgi:feruloyl esterase